MRIMIIANHYRIKRGRSDNIAVKRTMMRNLRMTGQTDIVKDIKKGQTKQLFNNLFKGLGLDIGG